MNTDMTQLQKKHRTNLCKKRGRSDKDTTKTTLNRRKNKGIAKERDSRTGLVISIHHAEGIDNPSSYPSVINRNYRVLFWVYPDDQLATELASGSPNLAWNKKYCIELDEARDCRFLYVEVLRCGSSSESEPGTSNGLRLVGRAKIALPNLSGKTQGRYGLVRLEEDGYKAEGHIILSMELMKIDQS
uniref:C2 domain-containing protein n=1 Tax=Salix viminalis TaxID=40686 RepID=A0A6N2M4J5_SALVM